MLKLQVLTPHFEKLKDVTSSNLHLEIDPSDIVFLNFDHILHHLGQEAPDLLNRSLGVGRLSRPATFFKAHR
jgi:hypothetical protein